MWVHLEEVAAASLANPWQHMAWQHSYSFKVDPLPTAWIGLGWIRRAILRAHYRTGQVYVVEALCVCFTVT